MIQDKCLRKIGTETVAETDGTWAQVTRKGNLVFISGQVGLDQKGNFPGAGDFESQARLALDNLVSVLKAAGGRLDDLMMITVFVTDMGNRPTFARVRDAYFRANPPASTIVEIKRLFMDGVLVEVNGIAVLG
jgi:enamine deaminase RidA (YjgF/YER057c/UK114 family)